MKKWIIRLVLAVVVLFIIAIAVLSFNLNRLVKDAINTYGPEVTKVSTSVSSVVLLPLSGKGRIGGLFVGNPSGYSTPSAIKVGGTSVSVDTSTIMDDKIVIRSIHIDDPEITLEGGLRENNLTKLLQNVEAYSKKSGGADASKDAGASKKLQIDSVTITGAKVHFSLPALKGKSATLPIRDIHLSNLGQGPEGVTASEVSSQLIDQILAQTVELIPQILAGTALQGLEISGDLAKEAGKLGLDLGKTGTEGAGKGAGAVTEGATKGVEEAAKSVGGLLKGLKKAK